MTREIKKWKKPELIEIVRCHLEESVLRVCKATASACQNEQIGVVRSLGAS